MTVFLRAREFSEGVGGIDVCNQAISYLGCAVLSAHKTKTVLPRLRRLLSLSLLFLPSWQYRYRLCTESQTVLL